MSHPTSKSALTGVALMVDRSRLSPSQVAGVRLAFVISGLVAIGLGTLMLVWTEATLAVIALLFGLYFVISGILRIVRGLVSTGAELGGRVFNIVFGLIMLIVGIVAIRNPEGSLAVLGLAIGISWIVEGIAALTEYTADASRWFGVLFGVIGIVAGVIVLFVPLQSLGVLVTVGGVALIVSGLVQLVLAFTIGRGGPAGTDSAVPA